MAIKKLIHIFCFVSFIMLAGCAQINIPFFGKSPTQSKTDKMPALEQPEFEPNIFVDKGRIVNRQRLQQGGNMVIIPFTAGVGIRATDELDKVALMVVKGISDAFSNDRSGKHDHFHVLTAESANEADFVVKGHITFIGKPSKIRRWVFRKRTKKVSVEGKITDAQTGEAILIFGDSAQSNTRDSEDTRLGYQIGNNIGQFILSGIQ